MGCVSSKQTVSVTPAFDHSGDNVGESGRTRVAEVKNKKKGELSGSELGKSGRASSNRKKSSYSESFSFKSSYSESFSFRLSNLQRYVEGEQVAAEAIQGWVPLRSDAFEKLENV